MAKREVSLFKELGLFLVYEHWRPDTNERFYIGSGYGKRPYDFRTRSDTWHKIRQALLAIGLDVVVKIVGKEKTAYDAMELEYSLIRKYPGLINVFQGTKYEQWPSDKRYAEIVAERKRKLGLWNGSTRNWS